jgi:FkbM family methyltransferase
MFEAVSKLVARLRQASPLGSQSGLMREGNEPLPQENEALRQGIEGLREGHAALHEENEALKAQLASVGLELADARERVRRFERAPATDERTEHEALRQGIEGLREGHAALHEENEALKAQLASVGLELADARERLRRFERTPAMDERTEQYRSRQSLILLPRLMNLLPKGERFTIVDGGAREVDRDPRWRPFPPERLRFIGFEPDVAEAERLNATPGPGGIEWQFVAAGLWGSSGTQNFEHNNVGGGSSFLRQNRALTDRWKFENPDETALARDIFFPLRYESMQVVSLADWSRDAQVECIDFLKLNVQGGELEILRGAGGLLDSVLGVLAEVSFVKSYHDRPLFGDIDQFLREQGFTFFDLLGHHYVGRASTPVAVQHLAVAEPKLGQLVSAWGQLIEAHALYLRDPLAVENPADLPSVRVLKLAALAEAFGQVEYAFELLKGLAARVDASDATMANGIRNVCAEAADQYGQLLRPGVIKRSAAPSVEVAK